MRSVVFGVTLSVLVIHFVVCDVTLQTAADYLVSWAHNNEMTINTNKTKELIICFNKKANAEEYCQNTAMTFGMEKLEWFGYPIVKKNCRYNYSF